MKRYAALPVVPWSGRWPSDSWRPGSASPPRRRRRTASEAPTRRRSASRPTTSPGPSRRATPRPSRPVWTEGAEYVDDDGTTLRGRAEIEKAFTELFKDKQRARLEVDVRSIRFPSKDVAIEEGILRHTPAGPGLPSSTLYTTTHVREDGKWLIAHSREWAGDQDRLGDLAFLLGKWEGGPKGEEMTLSFAKDPDGPFINGRFARQVGGKAGPTGTVRIGLDAQRGQLRSWHFDADGGQGQCVVAAGQGQVGAGRGRGGRRRDRHGGRQHPLPARARRDRLAVGRPARGRRRRCRTRCRSS